MRGVISENLISAFGILISLVLIFLIAQIIFGDASKQAVEVSQRKIARDIAGGIDRMASEAGSGLIDYKLPDGVNVDLEITERSVLVKSDAGVQSASFSAARNSHTHTLDGEKQICIIKNGFDGSITVNAGACSCNRFDQVCDPECVVEGVCDASCKVPIKDSICNPACTIDGDGICDPDCYTNRADTVWDADCKKSTGDSICDPDSAKADGFCDPDCIGVAGFCDKDCADYSSKCSVSAAGPIGGGAGSSSTTPPTPPTPPGNEPGTGGSGTGNGGNGGGQPDGGDLQASIEASPSSGRAGMQFVITLKTSAGQPSAIVTITPAGSQPGPLAVYDDGSHGDGQAADGTFANKWDSTGKAPGTYTASFAGKQATFIIESISSGVCKTIIDNGDPSKKLDLLFVGSGYQSFDSLENDAMRAAQKLFTFEPFKSKQSKINVRILDKNTDFSCSIGCYPQSPILVCCDLSKVTQEAAACNNDKVIVMIRGLTTLKANTQNGIVLTAAPDTSTMVHEFGHAFGGLLDEYVTGPSAGTQSGARLNCESTPSCPRWSNIPGTGCFLGCALANWYRPTDKSIMSDTNSNTFGPYNEKVLSDLLDQYG